MNTIGQFFYRSTMMAVVVLLVLVIAVPASSPVSAQPVLQAGAPVSDDFNRCSFNSAVWDFENPANASGASPVITGPYSGESYLQMSIPAGNKQFTFSSTNRDAPRLMQSVSDTDLNFEVKFIAPVRSNTADFVMSGVLIRDASNPSQPKWFRFDFNSSNGTLKSYHGYVNASGSLIHIQNVTDLPGGNPASGPLYIRVNRTGGSWSITHQVGASGSNVSTKDFQESTYDSNFTVTDVGVFVGHSSKTTSFPAHTMRVDYFRNMNDANFLANEDQVKLTVQTAGVGLGTVDWPMTNPGQCSGNVVTLTATPGSGSAFAGWSGDASGTNPVVNVVMNASKTVVATFNLTIDLPFDYYLPYIRR